MNPTLLSFLFVAVLSASVINYQADDGSASNNGS